MAVCCRSHSASLGGTYELSTCGDVLLGVCYRSLTETAGTFARHTSSLRMVRHDCTDRSAPRICGVSIGFHLVPGRVSADRLCPESPHQDRVVSHRIFPECLAFRFLIPCPLALIGRKRSAFGFLQDYGYRYCMDSLFHDRSRSCLVLSRLAQRASGEMWYCRGTLDPELCPEFSGSGELGDVSISLESHVRRGRADVPCLEGVRSPLGSSFFRCLH